MKTHPSARRIVRARLVSLSLVVVTLAAIELSLGASFVSRLGPATTTAAITTTAAELPPTPEMTMGTFMAAMR
jgi:hypothetical protein